MKYTLKEMPIEERPRERLVKYGAKALSNRITSDFTNNRTKGVSVVEVAVNYSSLLKVYKTLMK